MLAALSRMDHTELEARHRLITRVPMHMRPRARAQASMEVGVPATCSVETIGPALSASPIVVVRHTRTHGRSRSGIITRREVRTVVGLSAKAATTYTRGETAMLIAEIKVGIGANGKTAVGTRSNGPKRCLGAGQYVERIRQAKREAIGLLDV